MAEPDYIAQNAEPLTEEQSRAWFRARAKECRDAGLEWARYSIHPTYGWLLTEGWRQRPTDEGEPRWQVTAPSPQGERP